VVAEEQQTLQKLEVSMSTREELAQEELAWEELAQEELVQEELVQEELTRTLQEPT
jgi:hypothetical protein